MSFEIVVRPVVPVPVLKPGNTDVAVASQDDQAIITWGGPPTASAQIVSRTENYSAPRTVYRWSGGVQAQTPPKPVINWTEVERRSHGVRISQPGHPENYVDVEVIDAIAFDTGSAFVVLRFNS